MNYYYRFAIIIIPLLAVSCGKALVASPPSEDAPAAVCYQMDTKSYTGIRTYRLGLFNLAGSFVGQGTYCDEIVDHTATRPGALWLAPCRVNSDGSPLTTEGIVTTPEYADHSGTYGLRANQSDCYIIAAMPAKAFSNDGGNYYYNWMHNEALYVSEKRNVYNRGTYLDNMYIYNSSEKIVLKDRRARINVHIECGQLEEAHIQRVTLSNRVYSARWSLLNGFSSSNYDTDNVNLYDCGGTPAHLVKDDGDVLETDENVFLPSIDFSDVAFSAMRPRLDIRLGTDTSHPSIARVTLAKKIEPMKDYTFYIYVSKSYVQIALSSSDWDDGGSFSTNHSESPRLMGTVSLDGWDVDTPVGTDGWNTSF